MKRVSVYTHTYFSVYAGTPQAPAVQKDKGLLWLPFQSMTKAPLSLLAIPNSWSFFSTLKQHVHIINITLYKFKYIYIYTQTMCHSQEIFTLKLFIKADWIPRKKKMFHQNFSSNLGLDLNPNSPTSLYLDNRPNLYSGIPTFSEQHKPHAEVCDSHSLAQSHYRQFWHPVPSIMLQCLGHVQEQWRMGIINCTSTDQRLAQTYLQRDCTSRNTVGDTGLQSTLKLSRNFIQWATNALSPFSSSSFLSPSG